MRRGERRVGYGRGNAVILGVDHVGVATDDPAGVAKFMTALGLRKSDAGMADDYGVACEFWRAPEGSLIEVVSPVREKSAVSDMLGQSGPGLFHIAFVADDIELEFSRLRGQGFTAVDSRPCRGARAGMRVLFMYLRKPASLLIELVQYEQ
ncbi:MAG TPA: VOC family protein [Streptosporangiaceae bacterium]